MSFDIGHFQRLRPFLYHLTAYENLSRIRHCGRLECAKFLLSGAGRCPTWARKRRYKNCKLQIDNMTVVVRDQTPLRKGNMALGADWSFDDFVEHLNKFVFFWPGTKEGPKPPGQRHFKRYRNEHPVLFRIRTKELFEANGSSKPLFCRYNSGAPRCSHGKRSPRGPKIFLEADSAPFTAGKVVEAVYAGQVALPEGAEYDCCPGGPWKPLFPGD